MKDQLQSAGLLPAEAEEVALMVMVHVISFQAAGDEQAMPVSGAASSIAVDSGSRGAVLRHGDGMDTLIPAPHEPAPATPATAHGHTLPLRRLPPPPLPQTHL